MDAQALLHTPTPDIVRERRIRDGAGAGVLWSRNPDAALELSALGVLAWDGREGKPPGPRYEWIGGNLLCNAAPTSFVLNGERFYSVDSFYEALKIAESTPERAICAVAPLREARRVARRFGGSDFSYRGACIAVRSAEHEGLLAAAIGAQVEQNPDVQTVASKRARQD